MLPVEEKTYTTEDIYKLPSGTRAELIDGQIYYMSPPLRKHQRILTDLLVTIDAQIKEHGGLCEIYPAPFAVLLNKDDRNYVEPDLSVICDPNKLDERGCNGAPDWIIEIVSPSSHRMDCFVKLFKYHSAGVILYWIVDPEKESVTVWDFEAETVEEYTYQDTISVNLCGGLSIDFSALKIKIFG